MDERSYQNAEPNYNIKEQLGNTHRIVAVLTLQAREPMADDIAAQQCIH